MPDGHMIPLGSYWTRADAAYSRAARETRAEMIAAGKERALAALDEFEDALSEIEAEAPGSMHHARLLLADARSEVGGVE